MTEKDVEMALEWVHEFLGDEEFYRAYNGMHEGWVMSFDYEGTPLVVYFDGDSGVAMAMPEPLSSGWAFRLESQYVLFCPETLAEMAEAIETEIFKMHRKP